MLREGGFRFGRWRPPRRRVLRFNAPLLQRLPDGTWRVSARIEGQEVFFESRLPLQPSVEAYLSAFLLPAMASGADLSVCAPVDRGWLRNIELVRSYAHQWWGFTGGCVTPTEARETPRGQGTGLFFTGGVDSFFALWQERERLDYLLFVEGFDLRLTSPEGLRRVVSDVADVARACGVEFGTVRTNLRDHPRLAAVGWNTMCIAALAAVAHCLRAVCATVLVADGEESFAPMNEAWSSDATRLVSHGGVTRLAKVRAIMEWPLVHRYLRVCWENRAGVNCGACEKCVRTQLQFHVAGGLDRLRTFPAGALRDRIDRVPWVPPRLANQWQEILAHTVEPDLRESLRGLLRRRPPHPLRRLVRAAVRRVARHFAP